jgi:hypothetical protein
MKKILLTSLALAVAAAPAIAHRGDDGPADQKRGPGHERPHKAKAKKAKGPKGLHHLRHACVVSGATADGVELSVLGGNRHMKRALDGADAFTATLDGDTLVRLVGKARHRPAGSTPRRLAKIGSYADLSAGDRVIVRFRVPRGEDVADVPAFRVIDRGPAKKCATTTPPADDGPGDDGGTL